jgi:DNA-binding beta-propeller fold protein YncE
VSPNGRNVYVASALPGAVAAFARDKSTGVLTQLGDPDGCIVASSTSGCTTGTGLDGAFTIAVSPNGKNVYVGAQGSGSEGTLAVFSRDKKTGTLTQLADPDGCLSEVARTGCTTVTRLGRPVDVVVSPNGKSVYVTSGEIDTVAVLSRDTKTGRLTQATGTSACVSLGGAGGCASGVGLDRPGLLAVSRDGKSVYVAASTSGAVAMFARDKRTGGLTQLVPGCVSQGGTGGCASGTALAGAAGIVVSRDGKNAYVTAPDSGAIAVFARD